LLAKRRRESKIPRSTTTPMAQESSGAFEAMAQKTS